MTEATAAMNESEMKNVTPKQKGFFGFMFSIIKTLFSWAFTAVKWLWNASKNLTIALAVILLIAVCYQIYDAFSIPGSSSANGPWISKNCIVTERPQFWFFGDTQFHFQSDGIKGYLDVDDKFLKIGATNKVGNDTEEISMKAYNVRLNPNHELGLINFENGLLHGSISTEANTMMLKFNGAIIGLGAPANDK